MAVHHPDPWLKLYEWFKQEVCFSDKKETNTQLTPCLCSCTEIHAYHIYEWQTDRQTDRLMNSKCVKTRWYAYNVNWLAFLHTNPLLKKVIFSKRKEFTPKQFNRVVSPESVYIPLTTKTCWHKITRSFCLKIDFNIFKGTISDKMSSPIFRRINNISC